MAKTNTAAKVEKEPLFHVVKKVDTPQWKAWAIRGGALVAALLICGLFIYAVAGIGFGEAFTQMFQGTFGKIGNSTSMRIKCWDTAIYATKLLAIAVALAPAFKMKFWNIGAEGQVLVGAVATAVVMHDLCNYVTGPLLYVLMFAACLLAGAVWGLIPAFFKAKWGTNETLFTLMMNYIAMKIMDYFYNTWKGTNSSMDAINRSTKIGWLPQIFNHGYTINIIVFLALAVFMFFYLKKTKHGYEISVVGESVSTARYAGINVTKVILRTMLLSGAICGLVGGLTVAGQSHTFTSSTTAGGYGFTAIIVAWLAKFNTLSMMGISLLIIFLEKGTGQLSNSYPAFGTGAGGILIGIVLFFVIGSEFFINYRVVGRKKATADGASSAPSIPETPEEKEEKAFEEIAAKFEAAEEAEAKQVEAAISEKQELPEAVEEVIADVAAELLEAEEATEEAVEEEAVEVAEEAVAVAEEAVAVAEDSAEQEVEE